MPLKLSARQDWSTRTTAASAIHTTMPYNTLVGLQSVPFWGQTTLVPSVLSAKRDCSLKSTIINKRVVTAHHPCKKTRF